MIDWRQSGWTGSLRKRVRREVREQIHNNPVAQRCRYPWFHRGLRLFFADRTFLGFVSYYAVLAIAVAMLELALSRYWPEILPAWTRNHPGNDIKGLLTTLAGILVTAQVGVIGVVAIAIGLVTLIIQGEDSGTDVQVYYHESLALQVVASSLALLAVLVAQILWPLQFLLHRYGEGTDLQFFKFVLALVHIVWLLVNVAGLAHFIATTFRFVQKSQREIFRERYTANVLHPAAMAKRISEVLYENASANFITTGQTSDPDITVTFGLDWDQPETVELKRAFAPPMIVHDVKFKWIRWAARRWWARCQKQAKIGRDRGIAGLPPDEPRLVFTPRLGVPLTGEVAWCWTKGGVPLEPLERWVMNRSFRFRRASDDA